MSTVTAQEVEQAKPATDASTQNETPGSPHFTANLDRDAHGGFKKLLVDFGQDQKQLWTSPARIHFSDAPWLVPFAGITAGLFVTDRQYSASLSQNASTISHYKTLSNVGLAGLAGAGAGMYLMSFPSHNEHWRETGFLAGEAALNSLIPIEVMKYSLGRERPYEGNGAFFHGGTSFPSEHAAAAWSIAGVIAHEYPGVLPKLLAYGTASAIDFSRIHGRQHFPSDVLVGSVLGYLVAQSVYNRRHEPELGGRAWQTPGEFMEGERNRSPAFMGSPYVPLESWVYPALERLAALGYLKTAMLGMRPWTRLECARLLDEANDTMQDEGAQEDSEVQKLHEALEAEFVEEKERLNGAPNLGVSLDSIYSRVTGISGQPLRDGYHFGQTIVNDYGRPYGGGFNNVTGLSTQATAGPFAIYLRGEYQHVPASPSYSLQTQQAIASADSTLPVPNGVGQLDHFHLIEASVAMTLSNVQISFGKQSLWLGPGESGPLLFSNNADSVMMFKIDSVSPYRLPLLSRILGPVRSEFFIGQLSGQQFDFNTVTNTLIGPGNVKPPPLLHGAKFSFRPTPNLEFGMDFTAQFGGPGLPVTWHNFLRTFYSHTANLADDPGKRLSAFDFNYRIPGLRNWLTLYCDSLVIDEYSPIGSSRPSINPGVYFPQLPKIHNLELRLEGATTDLNLPAHFGNGAVYHDGRFRSGYTNEGNLLGNWVGRMGRGEQLWATYSFSPRNTIQFGIRHNNVDKGFIGGGHFYDWSLATDVMLRRDISLTAKVQFEPWEFPALSPVPQSDVSASVGMTFWPKWGKK
jgi:membrane-associated phospholipid phosphatase